LLLKQTEGKDLKVISRVTDKPDQQLPCRRARLLPPGLDDRIARRLFVSNRFDKSDKERRQEL